MDIDNNLKLIYNYTVFLKFNKFIGRVKMKDTLYGDLSVIGMRGCEDFVAEVDAYLKEWRRHDSDTTFLIDSSCPVLVAVRVRELSTNP